MSSPKPILAPGRNCWRIARAERFRCVQDAELYFRLVRDAVSKAERTVFILAWDVAAGVTLVPNASGSDAALPTELAPLLDFVVRKRPDLHCYVLTWDYAAVYAFERDPLTKLRLGWKTHSRVHFRFDGRHPFGASQHQKIVVIDDRLAFSGGLDLTHHRWDTDEHLCEHPSRVSAMGKPYTPFHDVQAMVEGPAAAALGEIARERWRRVSRRRTPRIAPRADRLWPADVEPDFLDVDVAISRTSPRFRRYPEVRECEALFLDSIAAASRSIYIENQYFTNMRLSKALAKRLEEPDGPEIVIVGPKECSGWLEEKTMGALRQAVLVQLLDADRHGRLKLLHPIASQARDVSTFVHSKVMIVDDDFLRIGSANLSNRSMGFDSECDLAVEARGDEDVRAGIARVRDRLMSEHLGVPSTQVAAAVAKARGASTARGGAASACATPLCAAIDALSGGDHTLVAIEVDRTLSVEPLVPADLAADPSEPMRVTQALDRFIPEAGEYQAGPRMRWLLVGLPVLAIAGACVSVLRVTDVAEWLHHESLHELVQSARSTPHAPLIACAAIVVGSSAFVPLSLMTLACVMILGPIAGGALSFVGAMVAAVIGYAAGRALGRKRVARLLGERAHRVQQKLHGRRSLSVAVLRLLPIIPETTVHLVSGAARLSIGEYLIGSAIGLVPGIVAISLLGWLFARALFEPSITRSVIAAAAALALAFLSLRVRHRLLRLELAPARRDHEERSLMG